MSKTITFYSYKGGVGRSMALANVAWILASNGKKVLVIDWDLEAPGLQQYFRPFLVDKDLASTDGLIDFVLEYAVAAMTPATPDELAPTADWYKSYANILRYAVSLDWHFDNGGGLDFVCAGRQGGAYAANVNAINWQSFYERLGGGQFFEEVKNRMRAEYDYVLIDSRAGIGDTSGTCTVQMPDALVVCFTLNRQNIEGAAAVVESIQKQRHERTASELAIFPVPMRLEHAEMAMLNTGKESARQRFALYPTQMAMSEREEYWSRVQFAYVPFYAYTEALAVFADEPSRRLSLLNSAEWLTTYLSDGEVSRMNPIADETRRRVLEQYGLPA